MPKVNRTRNRLHATAVPHKRTFAVQDNAVRSLETLQAGVSPDDLNPSTLLKEFRQDPSLLERGQSGASQPAQCAPMGSGMDSEILPRNGTEGQPLASKKEKQARRRQDFLKKLHHAHTTLAEERAGKRKRKNILVNPAGLNDIKQSLQKIAGDISATGSSHQSELPGGPSSLPTAASSRHKSKKLTNKGRQKLL
ncbi:hypothetical protein IWQ62_005576 [Dispira parvispora]|uniref:Ribosome biogenesis protein SLX9 n=1 Tax=Dispira parvispora TaxID=1520584 RepID=A0A9W8AQP3_9FUNG|nr:hypothetical protein IWQ62_005576 [Dispira parvispora]